MVCKINLETEMSKLLIDQYKQIFNTLRKGVTKYGLAPHKLILLLAVIREIEAGRIVQNRIGVTDALIESFMTVCGKQCNMPLCRLMCLSYWLIPFIEKY